MIYTVLHCPSFPRVILSPYIPWHKIELHGSNCVFPLPLFLLALLLNLTSKVIKSFNSLVPLNLDLLIVAVRSILLVCMHWFAWEAPALLLHVLWNQTPNIFPSLIMFCRTQIDVSLSLSIMAATCFVAIGMTSSTSQLSPQRLEL